SSNLGTVPLWNNNSGTSLKDGGNTLSTLSINASVAGPGGVTNMPGVLDLSPTFTGTAAAFSKGYNFKINDALNAGTVTANYLYRVGVEDVATQPLTVGRVALQSNLTIPGITSGTTTYFYVANAGRSIVSGTDATGLSNIFAGADQVWALAGATGYSELIGRE